MSVTQPRGFSAAGVAAGLKRSGGLDVAVVVNDGPNDTVAAVYTCNRCRAHPVWWSEQVTKAGHARAVVLNSGGANCYTGPAGFANTHATAELAGEILNCGAGEIVVCSTGLIGLPNDREPLLAGVRSALAARAPGGGAAAAQAIMTTDSRAKQAVAQGDGYLIGGMAKGAGMLAPALATMLVVLTTDADLDPTSADEALRAATAASFDRLDSDGCQSTNDTVVLLCSGASGTTPGTGDFTATLTGICIDLARQLQSDAEGAEHDINIDVVGAASVQDALDVGRAVARSNLFKTAIFGRDPNWGRILAAVGTTQAEFDPLNLDVAINGVWVCRDSAPAQDPSEVDLSGREVTVRVDLRSGQESATVWTNDLTHTYIHENSAYST
ncbi:MAG: bifunctional ornithine acetyltransferase/N-acetylglutamate synthase [Micrococcales bacterium]|nr:MAG: bifunctional ornithine acetyltransferase/N-acetylglutamate synthase [Micrococcales bacterium]